MSLFLMQIRFYDIPNIFRMQQKRIGKMFLLITRLNTAKPPFGGCRVLLRDFVVDVRFRGLSHPGEL